MSSQRSFDDGEPWRDSFKALRAKFSAAAKGRESSGLSIEVRDSNHLPKSRTVPFSFRTYRNKPRHLWWLGQFDPGVGGDDRAKWEEFLSLSKEGGAILRNSPNSQPADLLMEDGIGNDDVWIMALFDLAWRDDPGSPLKAKCKFGPDLISGAKAKEQPEGLIAELSENPFIASAWAIDMLLGLARGKVIATQPVRESKPALDDIDKNILTAMATYSVAKSRYDIAAKAGCDRDICALRIKALIEHGYAGWKYAKTSSNRPPVTITEKGQTYLANAKPN